MPKLTVIYKDPKALRPREKNPRKHPKRQIEQLKRSITEFGFVRPVLLDASDGIIAGHGSTLAAIELGMTDMPTVRVDHLSPDQIRAYVIADNKLAENAGWDTELLTLELKELSLSFDVTLTGFELPEVDLLLGELAPGSDGADEIPEIDTKRPAVTRAGDLWRIGEHFLLCGDSTKRESYHALLKGAKAQAVFTDPPYNVRIAGNVSGLGKTVHQEFAMASGEMSQEEFTEFLTTVFGHLAKSSVDGSIHYICMDWRHMREMLDSAGAYSEMKNLCVWAKTNAGMGSLYRSQHELVFVFKNGTAGHINNVELGRFGRNRTNVWTYAGVNTFGKERDAELAMHPTVKPVALVADAILDCSHRGGIVLDAFAGSGSTLIAAEKTGRRGYGIEFEPRYCDTIIRRFEKVYGLTAMHVESGSSFEDIAVQQLRESARDGEE
jgi:DNA modification methylase